MKNDIVSRSYKVNTCICENADGKYKYKYVSNMLTT